MKKVYLSGVNVAINNIRGLVRYIPTRSARFQPTEEGVTITDQEIGESFNIDLDELQNGDGVGFASVEDASAYLTEFIGSFKTGGTSGQNPSEKNFTLTAENYDELSQTPGAEVGELAFAFNNQGTKYLPGTLGGTFFPSGVYVWSGAEWVSSRNAFAQELQRLQTGWGFYVDTEYTNQNPFVVPQGQALKLPNNKGVTIEPNLPLGYSTFYDGTKIRTKNINDSITVSVRFKVRSSINQGGLAYTLDIGGTQGAIIGDSRRLLRTANVENPINLESSPFTGSTFIQNGSDVFIEAVSGNLSIYEIAYKITLDHQGK